MVAAAPRGAVRGGGRGPPMLPLCRSSCPHPSDHPPPEAPNRPGWVPRRPVPNDGSAPPGRRATEAAQRPARPAWALPAALVAMAVVYPAAFYFQVVPFWSAMVAFSAFSWWAAWHPYLRTRLRPTRRLVLMGLISGVALYLCFCAGALVVQETPLWPRIQEVLDLTRTTAPGAAAALVIVFATSPSEEVLWRGAVFARLTRRYGPGWRPLVATTALYALFVGLSGSPVLLPWPPWSAAPCGRGSGRSRGASCPAWCRTPSGRC